MSGIAVAGSAVLDHYKTIEAYPPESALTTVGDIASAPGGLLCNCAFDLAHLDPHVRIPVVGRIGADPAGQQLLSYFRQYPNVDVTQIKRSGITSFTDVFENSSTKSRTFFHFRGANAEFDIDDVDFDVLDADILHVGYLLALDRLDSPDAKFGTRMARLLATARAHGVATSIDLVSENSERFTAIVPAALRHTDYCVINEDEAERTTGVPLHDSSGRVTESGLRSAAEALLSLGVSTWAVIHWRGGAAGLSAAGEWAVTPSIALPADHIVTTTGAGDAFASGVLYAAWSHLPLTDALAAGIGTATSSLTAPNATDGVRDFASMRRLYDTSDYEPL